MRSRPKSIAIAVALIATLSSVGAVWAADPIRVIAAENFYGDLASQVGGEHVAVASILSNPEDDPHLFESSRSTARAIADAQVIIYNGADYDPWMDKLLSASSSADRTTIVAAGPRRHEKRRQPASVVRPEDPAGGRRGAGRRA